MSRYIDADALKKWIDEYVSVFKKSDKKEIKGYIEHQTTIEPKRGEWISEGKRIYRCSNCGNYLDFDGVNAGRGDANFCPNCGADMREREGE